MVKLEVLIGNDDPILYVVSNDKILVGKDPDCDVVILDSKVSRKHLEIKLSAGKAFVKDLSSTNGTYINDERVAPEEEREFFSFLPLRLGPNVYLALVSEEEVRGEEPLSASEKTQIVSLKELTSKKAPPKLKKLTKKTASKKKGKRFVFSPSVAFLKSRKFLGLVIFLSAITYTYYEGRQEVRPPPQPLVKVPEVKAKPLFLMNESEFLEKFDAVYEVEKCRTPREKSLCSAINSSSENWGAVEIKQDIFLFVNGKRYMEKATRILEGTNSRKEINDLASALFISEGIKDVDYPDLKEKVIFIGLYDRPEKLGLKSIIRITPEALENVKVLLVKHRLDAVANEGVKVINFTHDYYSVMSIN